MVLYKFIRNLRYTLALALGFGFISSGIAFSVHMIINDYNNETAYQTLMGIPSHYYALVGFVIPLLLFFKRKKTSYYVTVGIGFIVAVILSILDFFNACDCDHLTEGDPSICQWAIVFFGGAFILKKLE